MAKKTTAPASAGANSSKSEAAQKAAQAKAAKKAAEVKAAKEKAADEAKAAAEKAEKEAAEKVAKEAEEKAAADEAALFAANNKMGPPATLGICVVIPYVSKLAQGEELKHAIRAWEKHLPDLGSIIIVGDSEDWFGKDIVHIPHKRMSLNPQLDVADKLATVIASSLVDQAFVWSNDDIYPISRVYPEDLMVRKAMGPLKLRGAEGSAYRENSANTMKALKNTGISGYDYATHLPVIFEKDKLAETLSRFECQKIGHLISTLYFNMHYPDDRPIILSVAATGSILAIVRSENPVPQIMDAVFKERKFINHNERGYKPCLPYLKKLLPQKSRFER